MSGSNQALNSCGCGGGVQPLTPAVPNNAPGLSALLYRAGAYGSFNQSMLAAVAATPGVNALTTREPDDPAVALIDAWACALDVLTFYQERIANEGFLRTAAERLSILQLADSIGYRPSPGVAASTFLAFTLETGPGRPSSVVLDVGTKAQSTPGQNQLPQIFETIEQIEARPEWNLLKARARKLVLPASGDAVIYLDGLSTELKKGDPVLLVGHERTADVTSHRWLLRRVVSVDLDVANNCTLVTLASALTADCPAENPQFFALRQRAQFFGYNAPEWKVMPDNIQSAYCRTTGKPADQFADWPGLTISAVGGFSTHTNATGLMGQYYNRYPGPAVFHRLDNALDFHWGAGLPDPAIAHNFFARWAGWVILPAETADVVGHATVYIDTPDEVAGELGEMKFNTLAQQNTGTLSVTVELARKPVAMPFMIRYRRVSHDAAAIRLSWDLGNGKTPVPASALSNAYLFPVQLDQPYPKLLANTWAVVANSQSTGLFEVLGVSEDSRTEFTLTAKTTRATLCGMALSDRFDDTLRQAAVYAQSESLAFATQPITTLVSGSFIDLDSQVDGLPPGRTLIVAGTGAADGSAAGEMVVLDHTELQDGVTRLVFVTALQRSYVRDSVAIYANVARATHGETKTETLGSANASAPFQTLQLRQKPLTYVSAPTPTGGQSTLSVRVNDLLWSETDSLFNAAAQDRVYVTSLSDAGDVTIQFGDGVNGARPPSGSSNVTAVYRVGTGLDGLVDANQINQPMSRPLGLKSVVNPLAPAGAADPETRDEARRNAPMTVLTLGRIVSLQDYEDFARAFSGIGKSKATLLWQDDHTVVHLTVATADGKPVDSSSDLYANLLSAIQLDRDPAGKVYLAGFDPLAFGVSAMVLVDTPQYLPDLVLAAVQSALVDAFSFVSREFAQGVAESEVEAVIQRVPGVAAVHLTSLYPSGFLTAPYLPPYGFYRRATSFPIRHPSFSFLPSRPARWESEAGVALMKPAQLLTIDPRSIDLQEMKQP